MSEQTDKLLKLIRNVPDYPQPGVLFRDITPLLADPVGFGEAIDALADGFAADGVDEVVGIEARGFILAAPVALALHAGFVPVRKPGKLPGPVNEVSYDLEYGSNTLQAHEDAFRPGSRVLIVDDVLATGGTVAATAELVRRGGSQVVGVMVLMELLDLHGRDRLEGLDVRAVLSL
jgi:adenine phosphoribosyltransferase